MNNEPLTEREQRTIALVRELDQLRQAEIERLQRECAFWRGQCQLLGTLTGVVSRKLKQLLERGPRPEDFQPFPRPRRPGRWHWSI